MSPNPAGVFACASILAAASTIAVGLRVAVRLSKKIRLGLDDFFVIFAWMLVWAFFIVLVIGTRNGTIGTHTAQNPVTHRVVVTWHEIAISKYQYISGILAILCYGFTKLSALFLFRRIFVGRIFNIVSWTFVALVSAWTITFFFGTIFQCGRNPSWFWGSPVTLAQHCGDYKYIQLANAVSDMILDLCILTIPLPIIYKLQMTLSQKLGLMFVFALGYCSTAAAITRVYFQVTDVYRTSVGARDVRGVATNYMVWGYVEAGVGVIAASLPTLRPLMNARLPESIFNSVRSKLSLSSNTSTSRLQQSHKRSAGGSMTDESENVDSPHREKFQKTSGIHTASVQHEKPYGSSENLPPGILISREFRVDESE